MSQPDPEQTARELEEVATELGLHPDTYKLLTALRESEAEFRKARHSEVKANLEHKSAILISDALRDTARRQRIDTLKEIHGKLMEYPEFDDMLDWVADAIRRGEEG